MSEFSESHHLRTSNPADAQALLQRASLHGHVLEPANGWTGLVAEGEPFRPNAELIRCNEGVLLRYMFAGDHGWAFEVYDRCACVARHECVWEDDLEFRSDINWPRLTALLALSSAQVDTIRAVLEPTSLEAIFEMQPAKVFADVLGISNVAWLSYDYVQRDAAAT